jgi:transcription antitermination factor NusG
MEADTSVDSYPPVEKSDDGKKTGAAEIYASPEEFAERKTSGVVEEEGLTATILEVTTNPRKIDYLWLDNGHVWRETENSRVRFKAGRKVRIEEGIFRSFNMTMEGTDKIVKVRRVK